MKRRLLLPFTLSAVLHAAALGVALVSPGVEAERPVFTVDVVWEQTARSQGASGATPGDAAGAAAAATAASVAPLAHPSRRDFAERETAPRDEVLPLEKPHPEEPDVAQATSGVSKDGPPARSSAAAVRETTETSRSSRRRQVVAARLLESKGVESLKEPDLPAAAATVVSAPTASAPGERDAGAGPARTSNGAASDRAGSGARGGEALRRVEPAYPPAARRRGLEGSVVLRVRFDAEGRPEDVVVKTGSGSEMLDGAARDAVKRWRFRGGAAGVVDVPITFRLRGAEPVQVTDAGAGRDK